MSNLLRAWKSTKAAHPSLLPYLTVFGEGEHLGEEVLPDPEVGQSASSSIGQVLEACMTSRPKNPLSFAVRDATFSPIG